MVFHKGRELYGLFEARRMTSRLSRVIVVEGYMDVVALAQFGVTFAVATLGTATTDDHLQSSSGKYLIWSSVLMVTALGSLLRKALMLVLPHLEDGQATFMFLPEGMTRLVIRREGKKDSSSGLILDWMCRLGCSRNCPRIWQTLDTI